MMGQAACCAAACRLQPRHAAGLRQFAHAQDVALAFGHGENAARVEQVEDVGRLRARVVGGPSASDQRCVSQRL
jgi:hypothetical protein